MSIFDSVVLAGLILLVTVWLALRIRAYLKASSCSMDSYGCIGCKSGCGKSSQALSPCAQPPDKRVLETDKPD